MTRPTAILMPPKSTASVLDYGINWKPWLETGDSIVSYSVTASPSGLTISTPTLTESEGKIVVSAFIGGGSANVSYTLLWQIVTANGLTDVESAVLNVLSF